MAKANPKSETTLTLSRTVPGSPQRVFEAWTDPSELERWCAPGDEYKTVIAEVDLDVGGKYRIGMQAPDGTTHVAYGTYRDVEAPRRLVFTWTWEGQEKDMGETLVTVEFHDRGRSTEVVLTHELFPNEDYREKHEQGWAGCLDRLAKRLSG